MTRASLFNRATTASIALMLLAQIAAVSIVSASPTRADAPSFASAAFERTWARTDQPVANGVTNRTWMWGPQANSRAIEEDYADAPGGKRIVQYFDKSRMEDNSYRTTEAPWDVTNGLLVKEMVSGQRQVGDEVFEARMPADTNIAGDPGSHPTYADIGRFDLRYEPATDLDSPLVTWVDATGVVADSSPLPPVKIYPGTRITMPGLDHSVASVFWDFMTSVGIVYENDTNIEAQLFESPYYVTGFPITEAYWSHVTTGGAPTTVLWQCFERRCLTFNPNNSPGWQVEAGNVGQHYYDWLHNDLPSPPTNLRLYHEWDDYYIAWESVDDDLDGYEVYLHDRDNSSFQHTLTVSGNEQTIHFWFGSTLIFGDCFRVRAFNAAGYSDWSDDACWPDIDLPRTPVDLQVQLGAEPTLHWSEQPESEVLGYAIWGGPRDAPISSEFTRVAIVDSGSLVFPIDLSTNFECYTVRAFNDRSYSGWASMACLDDK